MSDAELSGGFVDGWVDEDQLFVFRCGGEYLAVDPGHVAAVSSNDLVRTRIPTAPAHLEGVVNYRGRALPVLDLARFLGLDGGGDASRLVVFAIGDVRVGVPVEFIRGIVGRPDRPRPLETGISYVVGVCDLDVGATQVLDLGALLEAAAERSR